MLEKARSFWDADKGRLCGTVVVHTEELYTRDTWLNGTDFFCERCHRGRHIGDGGYRYGVEGI